MHIYIMCLRTDYSAWWSDYSTREIMQETTVESTDVGDIFNVAYLRKVKRINIIIYCV